MNPDTSIATSEIQLQIAAIEKDSALYEETNFNKRADTLDFIDFHIIDRIEGLRQMPGQEKEFDVLTEHAERIKNNLEEIDAALFEQIRQNIRMGVYTNSSFREMISRHVGDINRDEIGYDNLDIFINGLLSNQPVPEPVTEQNPEMVFYQKTPARVVLEMLQLAQLNKNDIFFDLGSGLGQVAIMVNLLSGITAVGIEYEPSYCNYAKESAYRLNLPNVVFINEDACKADLSQGTIFFMYTPFGGSMLQNMMNALEKESQKRTINIFTYGPCSATVANQHWLTCINGNADSHHKLYQFKSLHKLVYAHGSE